MINKYRQKQHELYAAARTHFIAHPAKLIALEKFLTDHLVEVIRTNAPALEADYNEASHLYPFWKNYPPCDRGRSPIQDQYPWIEVGEHAIGSKLSRLLEKEFSIRDTGLPTGADQRFVLTSDKIHTVTSGYTNSAWLFVDIKSVGPRDDFDHAVMSHNQISGNGIWRVADEGLTNGILTAQGARTSHNFHATLPPIYVLSDRTVAPIVILALKPVYKMLAANSSYVRNEGQPLQRIDVACIPNGLLLTENPNYLKSTPTLLFPGKDKKDKDPLKLRARVDFNLLRQIANWRVQSVSISPP
jgi:hypothetical protein